LYYQPSDPALAERCHALQAEMLTWAENRTGKTKHQEQFDGSFASLVGLYETHEDSPYHELAEVT
jgi:hypothetical protein